MLQKSGDDMKNCDRWWRNKAWTEFNFTQSHNLEKPTTEFHAQMQTLCRNALAYDGNLCWLFGRIDVVMFFWLGQMSCSSAHLHFAIHKQYALAISHFGILGMAPQSCSLLLQVISHLNECPFNEPLAGNQMKDWRLPPLLVCDGTSGISFGHPKSIHYPNSPEWLDMTRPTRKWTRFVGLDLQMEASWLTDDLYFPTSKITSIILWARNHLASLRTVSWHKLWKITPVACDSRRDI